MQINDQLQQSLSLPTVPKRIVSLVPSQTELLVSLGLEDNIVGITKFCVHPSSLRSNKNIVGGTKEVDFKRIKSLQPDIILCNKEENTKAMVLACKDIAPVYVSDIVTIEENNQMIKDFGQMFNVEMKAEQLLGLINGAVAQLEKTINKLPKLQVAYFIWRKPYMVAGNNTFINHLLKRGGFINAFKDVSRYPEVSLDNDNLKNVDYIFLSSEPFPFKPKFAKEFISQFGQEKIKYVDGEYFSWYGSRLVDALHYFKKLRCSL